MDDLRGKRVLVTGGAGFIGANLIREILRRDAKVHAVIRPTTWLWRIEELLPGIDLHRADLTDGEEVQRAVHKVRPDIIFHLAATAGHPASPQDRKMTLKTHVLGTANLLEAVASVDFERFIHMGGSLEYGPRDEPLSESHRLEPSTFRGVAKAASTLLCQQFARAHSRPLVVLRLFSVYGYWEPATRLVPTAILAALRGQEMALTVPGFRRDFIFVEDVVEACLMAVQAENVSGEVINVGSGQQWSNEEVVERVQALSGQRLSVRTGVYPARPSDTTHWVADIQKARKLLGWEPRHTLRSGLEKTIAWFHRHQHAYERANLFG